MRVSYENNVFDKLAHTIQSQSKRDDALVSNSEIKLKSACDENSWKFLPVQLSTGDRVLHSGCAVHRILGHLDAGEVSEALGDTINKVLPEPRLHCVVSEDAFKRFPQDKRKDGRSDIHICMYSPQT